MSNPLVKRSNHAPHMVVPRRIDVIRDDATVDTMLRLQFDDDVLLVPIGPKLVATLIQGLQRAQLMVLEAPTTKQ